MNNYLRVSIWLLVILVCVFILAGSLKWINNSNIATGIMNICLIVIYGYCAYFSHWISTCVDSPKKEDI